MEKTYMDMLVEIYEKQEVMIKAIIKLNEDIEYIKGALDFLGGKPSESKHITPMHLEQPDPIECGHAKRIMESVVGKDIAAGLNIHGC